MDRADIRGIVEATYPDENDYTLRNWTSQLFCFRHKIAVGDLVVLPRMNGQYAIGHITGEYAYRSDTEDGMRHIRSVDWSRTEVPRETFRPDLLQSLGSLLTVFELRRFDAAQRLALVAEGSDDPGRPDDGEPGASLTGRRVLIERARDHDSDTQEPVTLTVRRLLELWGAERRDRATVARIRRDLDEAGLLSVPPFTEGTQDSVIALIVAGAEPDEDGPSQLSRIARSAVTEAPSETTPVSRADGVDSAELSGAAGRLRSGARRRELPTTTYRPTRCASTRAPASTS
ncbi:hypothetical protein V2W30_34480 [Streptomyces sp. Q6]|uniref:Uncharacterized protein n=1 Tax=Streptomyces citrinus TaxID=3118173 RepID=A0ACD5ALN5_9ACTN